MKQLHVIISGKVQGVFFRHFTKKRASALGLSGWVRNTADKKVEAVFEGRRDTLQKMLQFCKRGPPGATVERVEETWGNATGEYAGFTVKH